MHYQTLLLYYGNQKYFNFLFETHDTENWNTQIVKIKSQFYCLPSSFSPETLAHYYNNVCNEW